MRRLGGPGEKTQDNADTALIQLFTSNKDGGTCRAVARAARASEKGSSSCSRRDRVLSNLGNHSGRRVQRSWELDRPQAAWRGAVVPEPWPRRTLDVPSTYPRRTLDATLDATLDVPSTYLYAHTVTTCTCSVEGQGLESSTHLTYPRRTLDVPSTLDAQGSGCCTAPCTVAMNPHTSELVP